MQIGTQNVDLHADFSWQKSYKANEFNAENVKLSSGESEYSGIVRGASGGLGMVSMARDMCQKLDLEIQTDSSSAKSMGSRRGLGKVRHIASELLWVQQVVAQQRARITKINGKTNSADLGTKYLSFPEIRRHLSSIGF